MKDESKRGHVGTVTWGHGAHIRGLEAQRLRGSVAQRDAGLKGGSMGRPDDWLWIYDHR